MGGWALKMKLMLTQLSTKLELKLKLSLATSLQLDIDVLLTIIIRKLNEMSAMFYGMEMHIKNEILNNVVTTPTQQKLSSIPA